ncbi:MAG: hypothetical protein IPL61_03130 [Myxococcales bacterium]|nr:hypothetical protein [Myxococcales bacterium]
MTRPTALAIAAALALTSARPGGAAADPPSDRTLVVVGLALALPTYAVGVVTHEGSHAVAAKLAGADVEVFRPWPGRDPRSGAFQLGLTRVTGLYGDKTRLAFYLAPKLTDLALLGAYVGYYHSDAYPASSYGQLVVVVLATGFWLDFAKDTILWSRHNDLVKAMTIVGATDELRRFPIRLGFALASAGLGYLVYQGHERMFASNDTPTATPLVLPVLSGAF